MDRRERYNDPEEMLRAALQGFQAGLWTAIPCIVESFDSAHMTLVLQPAIKAVITAEDGSKSTVSLPLLLDCPVIFPTGGGFTLTFPIEPGDEVLAIFACRCIDSWYQSGGIQEQAEFRMHDLSDGFALAGVHSKPRVISAISSNSTQLRTDDGSTFIEVSDGDIVITAPASVTINASDAIVNADTVEVNASSSVTVDCPETTFTGEVVVEGLLSYQAGIAGVGGAHGSTITGDIIQTGGIISSEGTILHTHEHSGVTGGSSNTGPPV